MKKIFILNLIVIGCFMALNAAYAEGKGEVMVSDFSAESGYKKVSSTKINAIDPITAANPISSFYP